MPVRLLARFVIVVAVLVLPVQAAADDERDAPAQELEESALNVEGVALEYHDIDLWQRIRDRYQLTALQSPLTARHEAWYADHPDATQRMLARSERYLHYIVEAVEARNMPSEIALLPMIESGFNPQALSSSRAAGIWQFMPVTGKHFGLRQNWWTDHRKGVIAATTAALDYLQKLHLMFGDWSLALAAYNAGEGTVSRALEKNRAQGLPTDYQSLSLPDETRNYVPKLQAIKNIINDPARYGLSIDSIPNRPYFARVKAPEQIDAQLAASLAGISSEEFGALNPEYNRPVLAARGQRTHEILLPVDAVETFQRNLSDYDRPLVSWQSYHARRGERIATIARRFDISAQELRRVNGLSQGDTLKETRQLLVPAREGARLPAHIEEVAHRPQPAARIEHTVQANETLFSIALRYGVTVKHLMERNRLQNSRLSIGQVLVIEPSALRPTRKQATRPQPARLAASSTALHRPGV